MGVILNGILGGFSGKVGPVVGGKWKDVDYMRSYVIPANPNTTGQQTVRAKFSAAVNYGKALLATLIQTYWDPFHSNMSGFNAWISANYSQLTAGNLLSLTSRMAQGSLEQLASFTAASIAGTTLTLTYSGAISGNGLATDTVHIVVYRFANNTVKYYTTTLDRSDNGGTVTVDNGTTEDDLCFIFLSRGTGASFTVSDSQAIEIKIP